MKNRIKLKTEQLKMHSMSEDDIANGRLIPEDDLDKLDLENLFKQD